MLSGAVDLPHRCKRDGCGLWPDKLVGTGNSRSTIEKVLKMTDATPDGPADSTADAGSAEQAAHSSSSKWPTKRFHAGRGQRVGNAVMSGLTRWGLVPHTYVMTTIGRRTGLPHNSPVTLVEDGQKRWLVAPYGPVSWVLNARAAGQITLSRRGKTQKYAIRELSADDAGPVLKSYLAIATATKSYFEATKDSPVADFIAEADRHPVFALVAVPPSADG
jgi:deazaflavin-dependent oxidoreductase (nitroreductase family)